MLQGPQVTWGQPDQIHLNHTQTLAFKVYLVFIAFSLLAAGIHFWKSRRTNRPTDTGIEEYNLRLLRSVSSLGRWILLNLLIWGLLTCTELRSFLNALSVQRTFGASLFLPLIVDVFQTLTLSLWVILILYITRWFILKRAERIVNPR
jgi:hypothetical protein